MDAFVNFVKEFGALILAALGVVVGVIAAIIKRNPQSIDGFILALDEAIAEVPSIVHLAEANYGSGHGDEKFMMAIRLGLQFVEKRLGRSCTQNERAVAINKLDTQIEQVLACPMKKGGS